MQNLIQKHINSHRDVLNNIEDNLMPVIETASIAVVETLKIGNKILLCGNGGSAADAQHIAAELTGRFKKERKGLPAIAITTDTSALTAIANDYGYDKVFSRQIEALANPDDTLIAISTSGNSTNVIEAINVAKEIGCNTIALCGKDGGKMAKMCDISIVIPSNDTAHIQEMHIMIGHIICSIVDSGE